MASKKRVVEKLKKVVPPEKPPSVQVTLNLSYEEVAKIDRVATRIAEQQREEGDFRVVSRNTAVRHLIAEAKA